MTETADFVIIGGGIAGAGAAAMLAPHGRVALLEAEDTTGFHTTGRSAAMFLRNYGNASVRALTAASEAFLDAPEPGFAEASFLSPRGEMILATDGEEDALTTLLGEAPSLEPLDPDEAVALVPILRRERIRAAAIERDARDIDVDRLLQSFLRAAKGAGAEIRTRARVSGFARRGGTWRVSSAAGEVEAPVVVNAAGAWADELAKMAGLAPLGLTPLRRSAAMIPAPEGHDVSRWPLIAGAHETWYARPDGGRLMVSPADEDPVEPMDAWADDMVLAEGLARYEEMVTTPVTRVERNWAGLRTFAPDRTLIAGFDPATEGFFWLAGQGGYGIQTAPAMSMLAGHLVAGAALPEGLDGAALAALSPARLRH